MKRLLALLLSLALLITACVTASAETASDYPGVDLSTPETITMYHVGNDLADWDRVSAKVNELLQQKINTTVNFVHVSFADFIANYTLYCASPDIDILYTAEWCNYADNARNGAFKPIDEEFLKTYMPKTYEAMPAFAWAEVKVEDRIEMLDAQIPDWSDAAKRCLSSLNEALKKKEVGLTDAYDIGPAYFLKLEQYDGNFEKLWEYHIKGILKEYLRGTRGIEEKMDSLKEAFDQYKDAE